MAVFRIERTRDYTVMSNHHLRNGKLSLKAKGLLSMMLSLPEDWNYTTRGLAAICKEGVDAIGGALRELETAGYIVRHLRRGHKLHFVLLEEVHHLRKVENGTADAVELVNHHFPHKAAFNIPHKLLELWTLRIFPGIPFVLVLFAVPAFQFVFAKLNLAFNGNAVLFVYRLPCITPSGAG